MVWLAEAEELFYEKGYTLSKIAKVFSKHCSTISRALKKNNEVKFEKEKERRKLESKDRHRERCRERWHKMNAKSGMKEGDITAMELSRIQAMDAAILSRDGEPKARPILNELDYFRSAYEYEKGSGLYKRSKRTAGGALVPTTLPKNIRPAKIDQGSSGRRRTKAGTSLVNNQRNRTIGAMN